MTKFAFKYLSFLTLTFLTLSANAWWGVGHMVVAHIAYQNLNAAAKAKVDALVTEFKKVTPSVTSFEQMAVWPDTLYYKQKIYLTFNWHFIDLTYNPDNTPRQTRVNPSNSSWAVKHIIRAFKDGEASPYEQSRMLAFLIHIVGDIHQPLHNISRVTARYPRGDRGGNDFKIIYRGEPVKLHQVWDNGFGELSGEETSANANAISNRLTNAYPRNYFGNKIFYLDPEIWVKEGYSNAVNTVYNTEEDVPPSTDYINKSKKLIEEEVVLAGYRLSEVLNASFGSH